MKIGMIITAIVVGFALMFGVAMFSYNNSAVNLEESLIAAQTNSANIATQYQNTLFEQVQVPDMMKDHIKELITASIEGRYGENGSRAIFQSITEQNPNVDPAVYTKIQQVIETGRKNFEREQTRMVDIKRVYSSKLRGQPSGFFMGMMGYPTIDLDKFQPVSTNRVKEMIETGVEEHIIFTK